MTIRVDMTADLREVRKLFKELGPGVHKAAYRALNDTITTVRAEGARDIKRRHKALKIGDIKREMRLTKANRHSLMAAATTKGKPLPLRLFKPSVLKAGVKATLGSKRVLIGKSGRRGFVIKAYRGDYFVRRSSTGRGVKVVRGPSLPGVFRATEDKFGRIARRRWNKAFPSRLQFEIEKAMTKARGAA